MDVLIASSSARQIEKGAPKLKDTEPSTRHYLADAWFTVGLEGDRALLERIDAALGAPRWPLALGRKAFQPGLPVRVLLSGGRPALFDEALVPTLAFFEEPLAGLEHVCPPAPPDPAWRVVLDAEAATAAVVPIARRMQPDHPLSFDKPRRFAPREVVVGMLQPVSADVPQ